MNIRGPLKLQYHAQSHIFSNEQEDLMHTLSGPLKTKVVFSGGAAAISPLYNVVHLNYLVKPFNTIQWVQNW